MSEVATPRFPCEGCGRKYTLKPELAGRRVKCKCGHVMTVPQAPPPEAPEVRLDDDLYDMAPEPAKPAAPKNRVPLAPVAPKAPLRPVETSAPSVGIEAAGVAMPAPSGIPLAYQKGPTQRERERMSGETLMDMKRDVYAPAALLVVGFIIYVGYYAMHYELGGAGMAMTAVGLGLMTLVKAVLLIGFAFVVAGPLGVSFGGIFTAALKLAAIAVFSDGVATWIDAGTAKMAGGAGGAFSGMLSFPVVLGVYWVLLIYLFSMDSGDSWLVVLILTVFSFMARWLILLLLLNAILSWGGVSGAALPGATPPASNNPQVAYVNDLKERDMLAEAREYIKGGRQMALTKAVDEWYAAGCKNVSFSLGGGFGQKAEPTGVIVELPKYKDKTREKAARQKCYDIAKAFYEEQNWSYDEDEMKDDGEDPYLMVRIH